MSALGQKQTFAVQKNMSALLPKADMCGAKRNVCFVPIADIPRGELCAITDENKETALGIRRPLSGTKAGTGGTAGALSLPYYEIQLES